MTKKRSLPTLSTLQSGIDELRITLKSLVRQINERFDGVDKRFVGVNERFKKVDDRFNKLEIQIDKRFNEQDDKFVEWKNELFTKIDNSYAKPIKDLQEEDAAAGFRLEDHSFLAT